MADKETPSVGESPLKEKETPITRHDNVVPMLKTRMAGQPRAQRVGRALSAAAKRRISETVKRQWTKRKEHQGIKVDRANFPLPSDCLGPLTQHPGGNGAEGQTLFLIAETGEQMAGREGVQNLLSDKMLHQIAPGVYFDGEGGKFFYLTAMHGCMTKRLPEIPGLDVPSFLRDVFVELRADMKGMAFIELMD